MTKKLNPDETYVKGHLYKLKSFSESNYCENSYHKWLDKTMIYIPSIKCGQYKRCKFEGINVKICRGNLPCHVNGVGNGMMYKHFSRNCPACKKKSKKVQSLTTIDALKLLCKLTHKWGLMINCDNDNDIPLSEVIKAAPYLGKEKNSQMLADNVGFFLFNTKQQMDEYYYETIGDDGPRKHYTNKYNGPARVHALTCDNKGQTMNENT